MSWRPSTRNTLLFWLLLPALSWAQDDLLRGTLDSLRGQEGVVLDGDALLSGRLLAGLYDATGYQLAWTRPTQIKALLSGIEDARVDGLRPEDFREPTVRALAEPGMLDALGPAARIGAELKLSDALLRFLIQVRFGRLDPTEVNPSWNHRPAIAALSLIESARAVLSAQDASEALVATTPRPFFYQNLRRALERYADVERLRDLPEIPGGKNLAVGSHGERVSLLRERLALLDESPTSTPPDLDTFDEDLSQSVMAFQLRFGLAADGIVGPTTLKTLNRPYDQAKIQKIQINLERMRWFYDALPEDFVLVDVAGFMAYVVRGGEIAWSTRVVVGTQEAQTPSFRDEMEHVVFNPTWTVPPSIQKKMRGAGSRYKVIDRRTGRAVRGANVSDFRRYALVQAAGPGNALGRVKFMFPNGHAIYLHDTPSKHLFSRRTRTYSHGCVRVKDPLKLAEVILDQPGWSQSAIKRVVNTSRTRYVNLDEHLPVLLYYLTAFADADGQVNLRPDVYGRDQALKRAFAGTASPPRLSFPDPLPIPEQPIPAQTPVVIPASAEPAAKEPTAPVATPLPGTTLTRDRGGASPTSGGQGSIAPRNLGQTQEPVLEQGTPESSI